jgi:hypothetical protein
MKYNIVYIPLKIGIICRTGFISMKISRVQIIFIATLCVLTFTVIVFDVHILNERALWIQAWGSTQDYSELRDSLMGTTNHRTPVNITNHPLKEAIMRYVNQSLKAGTERFGVVRGETVYIVNHPEMESFFGQYSFSSWCYTCMLNAMPILKDGDTYYPVMVSHRRVPPSVFNRVMIWAVSIATVALWICTVSIHELASAFGSFGVGLIAFGFLLLYLGSTSEILLTSAILFVITGIVFILRGVIRKQEPKQQSSVDDYSENLVKA